MKERIEKSLTLIRKARELAKAHDYRQAARSFADAFYLRSVDEGFFDLEYATFYRYQFAVYLSGKRVMNVSLAEGDMIADLIRATYEDMREAMLNSPFNLDEMGEWNLLKEVRIDFPRQNCPLLAEISKPVSF